MASSDWSQDATGTGTTPHGGMIGDITMCVRCLEVEATLCSASEGIAFATATIDDALEDIYKIHRKAIDEGDAVVLSTGSISIAHYACKADLINAYMRMHTAVRALRSISKEAEDMLDNISKKGIELFQKRQLEA